LIETERLILRGWRAEDREPFVAMMLDDEISRWLDGPFTREQALTRADKQEASLAAHGYGRMVIERRSDGAFLGYCGLAPTGDRPPVPVGFEIGWGLAQAAWGGGYATEAARAVFADGFTRLDLPEILAFTGEKNLRSQAVMRRLGMTRTPALDFDHPALADDHPLKRHIVFVAPRP
jgi:RimJ/RimL family protein N-acetyltransferase